MRWAFALLLVALAAATAAPRPASGVHTGGAPSSAGARSSDLDFGPERGPVGGHNHGARNHRWNNVQRVSVYDGSRPRDVKRPYVDDSVLLERSGRSGSEETEKPEKPVEPEAMVMETEKPEKPEKPETEEPEAMVPETETETEEPEAMVTETADLEKTEKDKEKTEKDAANSTTTTATTTTSTTATTTTVVSSVKVQDGTSSNSTNDKPIISKEAAEALAASGSVVFLIIVSVFVLVAARKRSRDDEDVPDTLLSAVQRDDKLAVETLLKTILPEMRRSSLLLEGGTQLHDVTYMSSSVPALDESDEVGNSAVLWAVANSNPAILKALLVKGASATVCNQAGVSPLHRAVQGDNCEVIQSLLEHGALANQKDPKTGHTPVMMAVRANKGIDHISLLGQFGADLDLTDDTSQTALHHAVLSNNVEASRSLLDLGADPNIKDTRGFTPLHWACLTGNAECAACLVACHRTDGLIADNSGQTALHLGAREGSVACLQAVLASQTHSDLLSLVLAGDCEHRLPVDYALERGHSDCAVLLSDCRRNLAEGPTYLAISPQTSSQDTSDGSPTSTPLCGSGSTGQPANQYIAGESAFKRGRKTEPADLQQQQAKNADLSPREKKRLYMRQKREVERRELNLKQAEVHALETENRRLQQQVDALRSEASALNGGGPQPSLCVTSPSSEHTVQDYRFQSTSPSSSDHTDHTGSDDSARFMEDSAPPLPGQTDTIPPAHAAKLSPDSHMTVVGVPVPLPTASPHSSCDSLCPLIPVE